MNEDSRLIDSSSKGYTNYSSLPNQDADINQEDIVEAARRVVNGLNDNGSGELHKYSPLYFRVHMLHYGRTAAMIGLLLLTFFETPWWCHQTPGNCENRDVFLFSNLPLAPAYVTDILALICLGILFCLLELRQIFMGRRDLLELSQSVIIVISVIDTIVALAWAGYREFIFISPFLRPVLFVLTFKKIREEFMQIVSLIPIIFELLLLLLILMISFSWFGLILFYDEEEFEKKYFSSYGEAMYNMFIFLTTANSPDVRMPMYWLFRPTVIYFIIFEVIGLYFILPFIFASVFNNYKDMVEAKKATIKKLKKTGLQAAFDLLDRSKIGSIKADVCRDVFLEVLKIVTPKNHVSESLEELVEYLLNQEGTDKDITRKEFRHLALDVSNLEKLEKQQEETHAMASVSELPFHSEVSTIILNPYFEVAINCLLVLNGLFFAMQTYYFIHSIDDYYRYRVLWTIVEYAFSLLWVCEMSAKIYVLGVRGYVAKPANVFDGTIILLGLATTLLSHLTIIDTRVVRIVLLIRTFRLLRLFSSVPKFRMIFATFLSLLPVFSTLLGVLVFQYYLFGLISIRAFGGLLYVGNPDLAGTAYEAAMYFPNNFNDFASTVVVLFDLMVINNWFIYMDAIALVTHSEASKLFFFLFYFFTNILTLNLLVANILDAVSGQMQKIKEEEVEEREKLLSLSRHPS